MISRHWLVAAILVTLAGCNDTGPKLIVPATPAPPTATPVPTPAPTPTPSATPTPTPGPNNPPEGVFKYMPPLDPDGGMHVGIGDTVHVNASRFKDPDGDPLYLTVHWGDGTSNHIACGLCRLEHAYLKFGRFELQAEVTDLNTKPVRRTIDVVVQ